MHERLLSIAGFCLHDNSTSEPVNANILRRLLSFMESDGACILGKDSSSSNNSSERLAPTPSCNSSDKWVPGWNVTPWIKRATPIQEQGQVLIVNVVVRLQALPKKIVHAIRRSLPECPLGQRRLPYPLQVAAYLLGMSAGTVDSVFRRVRDQLWEPVRPKPPSSEGSLPRTEDIHAGGLSSVDEDFNMLRNVIRVALGNAVRGGSYLAYVTDLHRMRLCDANVGTKYGSRQFAQQATALASLVLQQLDAHDFNQILSGLGIPSDFLHSCRPGQHWVGSSCEA